MTGTILNVAGVLLGGMLGLVVGNRLPDRISKTVIVGIALFSMALGIQLFLESNNSFIVLASIVLGAVIGEALRLDERLQSFGAWLQARFIPKAEGEDSGSFLKGFLTASLLFCVGPIAILGSIQDGLTGDYSLLSIKALLDGVSTMAFVATLGIGAMFAVIPLFLYQGGITLLAGQLQGVLNEAVIAEMSAVGGILMIGIAINLLEISEIKLANLLPAIFIAPLIIIITSF